MYGAGNDDWYSFNRVVRVMTGEPLKEAFSTATYFQSVFLERSLCLSGSEKGLSQPEVVCVNIQSQESLSSLSRAFTEHSAYTSSLATEGACRESVSKMISSLFKPLYLPTSYTFFVSLHRSFAGMLK